MGTSLTKGLITDTEKPVQGTALYVEFHHETRGVTTQVFLTPDGTDETGKTTFAKFFTRTLTPDRPKRQWQSYYLRNDLVDADEASSLEHRYGRIAHLEITFKRLSLQGFTIVKKPFVVEVSQKDLADVRTGKTPTKVIYRIGQTRTALGFPESLTK